MRTKPHKNGNPLFRALWDHCRAKPLAVEDHPWGDMVFKVGGTSGKIFAFLGHPEADDVGVTVKPSPEELGELLGCHSFGAHLTSDATGGSMCRFGIVAA